MLQYGSVLFPDIPIVFGGVEKQFIENRTLVPGISGFQTLEDIERDYILQVLKAMNWKVQGTNSAASVLGMHPNTLRSRVKKLGIQGRRKSG